MKFIFIILTGLLTHGALAEYNVKCPAPKICQNLYDSLRDCKKGNEIRCNQFIKLYKKAIPKYDCQPKDAKSSDEYVVPAIWICDNHEYLLNSLSKLKSPQAKKLYGSSKLRSTLDGDLAEQHLKKSKLAEKYLKTGN